MLPLRRWLAPDVERIGGEDSDEPVLAGVPAEPLPGSGGRATHAVRPLGTLSWDCGAYGYDHAGNIASTGTNRYAYDAVERLKTANTSGVAETHGYDAFGNMNQRTLGGSTQQFTVSAQTNQLTSDGTAAPYSYDGAGYMKTGGFYTWAYDASGQATTKQYSGCGSAADPCNTDVPKPAPAPVPQLPPGAIVRPTFFWDHPADWLVDITTFSHGLEARDMSNFVGGFGNGASYGLTGWIQDQWDPKVWDGAQNRDEDSLAYDTGLKCGIVIQTAIQLEGARTGYEFKFGKDLRIALGATERRVPPAVIHIITVVIRDAAGESAVTGLGTFLHQAEGGGLVSDEH